MQYKNIEVHNIGKIREGEQSDGFRWCRVPEDVYESMETDLGKIMCRISTGVELRFVMKSDKVTIRMRTLGDDPCGVFHVYRGSIQGSCTDHEGKKAVGKEFEDFVIDQSKHLPMLRRITKDFDYPFDPEVVRVIFDRGAFEIAEIIGDVEPPKPEQMPAKTMLAYGSSITHGSNSIDQSHSWVSVVGHNLKMDCWNLGMAGSCCMEPALVDYMAREGENGKWDLAVLELGINVLDDWEEELFRERVDNTVKQIAGRNPEKPVYVISPFYCYADYNGEEKIKRWREVVEQSVRELNYPNVTYINGLDLLGDMSLISGDVVHPNIYGVDQIAHRLTEIIKG